MRNLFKHIGYTLLGTTIMGGIVAGWFSGAWLLEHYAKQTWLTILALVLIFVAHWLGEWWTEGRNYLKRNDEGHE